jgi:hypothetical protein
MFVERQKESVKFSVSVAGNLTEIQIQYKSTFLDL